MSSALIDVWSAKTFDPELNAVLWEASDLVRNYMTTDHEIFLDYDRGRCSERPVFRPENPYASRFSALQETIGKVMQSRTMRAWHYTRLTPTEVDSLGLEGIHVSTPRTLRIRLDSLVASGDLNTRVAEALYAASPLHGDQGEARSGKFWMVSHPLNVNDSGVRPLMAHWGGESASFWTKDPLLLTSLSDVGEPHVIELAVPLYLTEHSYFAGIAVTATFGRSLGCIPDRHVFDLYVTKPLGPDSVLRVHSEGGSSFGSIGLSYPEDYIDLNVGRW